MDLLVEFALLGQPVSLQTKNRQRLRDYKRNLRIQGVRYRTRAAAPGEDVFFSIGAFAWTGNRADSDNIIKPAQDAMEDADIFANDSQVRDSLGFTRPTVALVTLSRLPHLQRALETGEEFIHIAVSSARDPHFEGIVDV